jgi:hypothetical protein
MADGSTTDMTGGLYRRIYAGFITGRRINAVSWPAEAWFWRLHAIADDFGNFPKSSAVLKGFAAPLKEVTAEQIRVMTEELESMKLLVPYESSGEFFLHIDGFERRQPAGKNGKRIQRYPRMEDVNIGSLRGIQENPGESSAIQVNPVQSGKSYPTITIPITIPITKNHGPLQAELWNGRHVDPSELSDTGKLRALHQEFITAGLISKSDSDRLDFVALALGCVRLGKRNRVGLFRKRMKDFQLARERIAGRDEDAANRLIKTWDGFQ